MWKQLILILALIFIALNQGVKAEEMSNILEHYAKSGAIPVEEARDIMIKNYQLVKKEKHLFPSRKIASEIQQHHIIRIQNSPLEIEAK